MAYYKLRLSSYDSLSDQRSPTMTHQQKKIKILKFLLKEKNYLRIWRNVSTHEKWQQKRKKLKNSNKNVKNLHVLFLSCLKLNSALFIYITSKKFILVFYYTLLSKAIQYNIYL
jgi:hypothetical protein